LRTDWVKTMTKTEALKLGNSILTRAGFTRELGSSPHIRYLDTTGVIADLTVASNTEGTKFVPWVKIHTEGGEVQCKVQLGPIEFLDDVNALTHKVHQSVRRLCFARYNQIKFEKGL